MLLDYSARPKLEHFGNSRRGPKSLMRLGAEWRLPVHDSDPALFSEIHTIYRRHTVAFKMLPASIELVRCDVYEPGIESPIVLAGHISMYARAHLQCTVIFNAWQG